MKDTNASLALPSLWPAGTAGLLLRGCRSLALACPLDEALAVLVCRERAVSLSADLIEPMVIFLGDEAPLVLRCAYAAPPEVVPDLGVPFCPTVLPDKPRDLGSASDSSMPKNDSPAMSKSTSV